MNENLNSQPWKANRVQWQNKTRENKNTTHTQIQTQTVGPGVPAWHFQVKLDKFPKSLPCTWMPTQNKMRELGAVPSEVLATSYTCDALCEFPSFSSLLRSASPVCTVCTTEATSEPPSGSDSARRILSIERTGPAYRGGLEWHLLPQNTQ